METNEKDSIQEQRYKTDQNLEHERHKTDNHLNQENKSVEQKSDNAINLNRLAEDNKLEHQRTAAEDDQNLIADRDRSDIARDKARAGVDKVLTEERLQKRSIPEALLVQERKQTDSSLLEERDQSDLASEKDSKMLSNEKSSHAKTLKALIAREQYATAAEAKYRRLLESAQDAIIIVGATGNIEFVNDQVTKWFGYERVELIGQPIEILIPERLRGVHKRQRDEYLAHPTQRPMGRIGLDLKGRRKDGSEFPVDVSLSPSETLEEKIVTAVIRDMTEKHRQEAQIRFLAKISRMLAASLDYDETLKKAAALIVSEIADGCIVRLLEDDGKLHVKAVANRNPERQLALENIVKSLDARGMYLVDTSSVLSMHEVLLKSEFKNSDFNNLAIDVDEQRQLKQLEIGSYAAIPLLIHDRLIGVLSFVSDVSRRRFEESDTIFFESVGMRVVLSIENARLYEEAQASIKVREEILAIVSHDLKNPLTTIDIAGQLLPKIKANDQPKLLVFSEKIRRATDQMQRMIADLMDFSKIQTGKLAIVKQAEYPNAVIALVFEMMKAQADEKGLKFSLEVSPVLPVIQCDKQRIVQALSNLVGNAIKFTENNGHIHLSAVETEGCVKFSVADTGPGISEEDLPKVFDRYWQAQRSKSLSAGIGLSITKGIIESHGGKIWVESKLGKGSIFYFMLPVSS